MQTYAISPEDANETLSFAHAMSEGYHIKLGDKDGTAQITNAKGDVYHIDDWCCDCQDATMRNGGSYIRPDGTRFCKHIAWICQLRPCPDCNATQIMRTIGGVHFFLCHGCGFIQSALLVKIEREQERQRVSAIFAAQEASSLVFGD